MERCGQNLRRKTEDGENLGQELSSAILKEIPSYVKFKDGDKFKVSARGNKSDPITETCDVNLLKPRLQTLEEWKEFLQQQARKYPTELDRLVEKVMEAQIFEFGEVDEDRLMRENPRALDLANKGFLNLPYECVIYRYTGKYRIAVIALREGTVLQYGAGTREHHLVWPLSLMLATKGTKLRIEEPSHKLQSKRLARGKPRLPHITYVDAEHYYIAMRNSESKRTHASPVPHLRRGHIRHWKDKEIWIKDMLINCTSVNEIKQRAKYKVRHAQG